MICLGECVTHGDRHGTSGHGGEQEAPWDGRGHPDGPEEKEKEGEGQAISGSGSGILRDERLVDNHRSA